MLFTQPAALAPILYLLFALSAASTLTPPVLPLVVRSPYLSTWLGNARAGMGSTDSHCGSVLNDCYRAMDKMANLLDRSRGMECLLRLRLCGQLMLFQDWHVHHGFEPRDTCRVSSAWTTSGLVNWSGKVVISFQPLDAVVL